jgi:hypothetical protein
MEKFEKTQDYIAILISQAVMRCHGLTLSRLACSWSFAASISLPLTSHHILYFTAV